MAPKMIDDAGRFVVHVIVIETMNVATAAQPPGKGTSPNQESETQGVPWPIPASPRQSGARETSMAGHTPTPRVRTNTFRGSRFVAGGAPQALTRLSASCANQ